MPAAHLLYAVALLASCASLYGVPGLVAGIIILGLWAFVFYSNDRPQALVPVVCFWILGLCCLFIPVLQLAQSSRGTSRRSECKNNLKYIGLALHNYHETYEFFPPAFIADENGKPMHSWRVLILPFFDLDEQELYEQYDFSKPWDSPENLKLLKHMPDVFRCPSSHTSQTEESETTNYVAIVGPQTAWPGSGSSEFSMMKDGTSNIVMVMENHSPDISWTEPRDLSLEEAADVFASEDYESFTGHRHQTFFREYLGGRNVLFGDGSVQFAPFGTDRTLARELMTINDGKPESDWDWYQSTALPRERVKWSVVIRFAIFVLLMLLPLPWVWLNPTGTKNHGLTKEAEPPPSASESGAAKES